MSPSSASWSPIFQSFLDDAVEKGVAPGFQCVVFDRESVLFNDVSGNATGPSDTAPEGIPFRPDTLVWLASASKISLSLIVLHIVERGLAKIGFSMKDLDSHEALVEVLPEFRHGSGSLVTKILEGFEEELGEDGKKVMKLRDAKGQVTLRMLLTHTAGMALYWNNPLIVDLYRPSDGSVPHFGIPFFTGDTRDFEAPLVTEPDTTYTYSCSSDWLGQFAVRSTGRSLRQLFKDIICEPLCIPSSEADLWIPPSLSTNQASIHVREANKSFRAIPFPLWSMEEPLPEGKAYFAPACIFSSLQGYAKVLQAVLNMDSKILSKKVWEMAVGDDLKDRGIKVPKPEWKSYLPDWSLDLDEYAKSTAEDGTGVNLLQCKVATAPTVSGRSAGSFGWGGLANTYFFIDPVKGIGAILGTQLLPFLDPQVAEMRDKLESLIYQTLFPV